MRGSLARRAAARGNGGWGGADAPPVRGRRRRGASSGRRRAPRVLALERTGSPMRFEVPAGTALVFSSTDGELLTEPVTRPIVRVVETAAGEV